MAARTEFIRYLLGTVASGVVALLTLPGCGHGCNEAGCIDGVSVVGVESDPGSFEVDACLNDDCKNGSAVPGRNGMSWEEEDWVDEDATAHRGKDE